MVWIYKPYRGLSLLRVKELRVFYGGYIAVNRVSFEVRKGEVLAIVGPSGSGKSTIAKAILRILPPLARVEGSIELDGTDLLRLSNDEMRRIRWERISYVPQGSSRMYLNPAKRIIDIVRDLCKIHGRDPDYEILRRLLEDVDLDSRILYRHPHELSGGQLQRILIVIAVLLNPEYIIADEPTSALDIITQRQIIDIFRRLVRKLGSGILLITHDMFVVRAISDRVAVIYNGMIAEYGDTSEILRNPRSSITRNLVEGSFLIE